MLSSMQDSDPVPDEPALTRRYLGGLLAGVAMGTAYCLLNILVDPTGEFGLSGRFSFNRAPPPAAIVQGEAGGNSAFHTRAIQESGASIFLLGQSRTWRGFDTCTRPQILRIAGSSWGISEIARLQDVILRSRARPVTLLVEIGLPQDERARAALPLTNAVSVALSPRTALFSLQTIVASLADDAAPPAYTSCRPNPSPRPNWAAAEGTLEAELTLIDATAESLRRGRDNVMAMADAADRICTNTGIRHRVTFFSLPATPAPTRAVGIDRIIRWNSRRIAEQFARRVAPPGGCIIRYENFADVPPGTAAQQALWRDRDQWSDYVHYSPRLGEIALVALLGAGSAGPAR
jgi:hypothetical protein